MQPTVSDRIIGEGEVRMAKEPKIVGEDCLEFYDEGGKVAVNLVPFERSTFIPRTGETIRLPGQGAGYGNGTYRVTSVEYLFASDDESDLPEEFGPAALNKVVIFVKKLR